MTKAIEAHRRHEPLDAGAMNPCRVDGRGLCERREMARDLPAFVHVLERTDEPRALIHVIHLPFQVVNGNPREQTVNDHVGVATHRRRKVDIVGQAEAKVTFFIDGVAGARVLFDADKRIDGGIAGAYVVVRVREAAQAGVEPIGNVDAALCEMLAHGQIRENHGGRDELVRGVLCIFQANSGREAGGHVDGEADRGQREIVVDGRGSLDGEAVEVLEVSRRHAHRKEPRDLLVVVASLHGNDRPVDLVGRDDALCESQLDRDGLAWPSDDKAEAIGGRVGIQEVLDVLVGEVECQAALAQAAFLVGCNGRGGHVDDVDVDDPAFDVDGKGVVEISGVDGVNGEGGKRGVVDDVAARVEGSSGSRGSRGSRSRPCGGTFCCRACRPCRRIQCEQARHVIARIRREARQHTLPPNRVEPQDEAIAHGRLDVECHDGLKRADRREIRDVIAKRGDRLYDRADRLGRARMERGVAQYHAVAW